MRLIDAEGLRAKIEELQKTFNDGGRIDIGIGYAAACNDCILRLDSAETVSSGLTMHGKWEKVTDGTDFDGETEGAICNGISPCGWLWRYCPHCGAKMALGVVE